MAIEVVVTGQGRSRDDVIERDAAAVAHCAVCDLDVALVVSVGPTFVCKDCIRLRLDATSVVAWQLREERGLPWGKVSG